MGGGRAVGWRGEGEARKTAPQVAIHQPSESSPGGLTVGGRETGVAEREGCAHPPDDKPAAARVCGCGAHIDAIAPFGASLTCGLPADRPVGAAACRCIDGRNVEAGGESGRAWCCSCWTSGCGEAHDDDADGGRCCDARGVSGRGW